MFKFLLIYFIIDFARKGLQKQILYVLLLYVITEGEMLFRFFLMRFIIDFVHK